jgi:Zn-dependent peptidase ImmA (M78 family)
VDALSITSKRPVIVRNDAKESPFRLRFDMAHELGHLVLHDGLTTGDRKTEAEANRFAAAFLMPRSTFMKAFPRRGSRIDWAGLSEMKMEFKATKAAILYRARSLGILDDYQYKGAIITMKNRGESISEVEDKFIVSEAAEVLPAAMKILADSHKITHQDLAANIGVTPSFLSQIVPTNVEATKPSPKLYLVPS